MIFPDSGSRYRRFRRGNRLENSLWMGVAAVDTFSTITRGSTQNEDPSNPESISFRTKMFGVVNSLLALEKKDAAWKLNALVEGSKKYFLTTQAAFARQDAAQLKVLMHSQFWARWKSATDSGSVPFEGGSFVVERVDIVHFVDRPGEEHDRFTTRLEVTRNLSTAALPGSPLSLHQKCVEFWTFARERRAWRLFNIESQDQFDARMRS
jgi:predicted lipid-binding transport protein (Tim44 family)